MYIALIFVVIFIIKVVVEIIICKLQKSKINNLSYSEKERNETNLYKSISVYKRKYYVLGRNKAYKNLLDNLKKDQVIYIKSRLDNYLKKLTSYAFSYDEIRIIKDLLIIDKVTLDNVINTYAYKKNIEVFKLNKLDINPIIEICKILDINVDEKLVKGRLKILSNKISHTTNKNSSNLPKSYKNLINTFYKEDNKDVEAIVKAFVNINKDKSKYSNEEFDYLYKICKELNVSVDNQKLRQYFNKELLRKDVIKEYKINKLQEGLSGDYIVTIEDVDTLNGYEFEDFLGKLFKNLGYNVHNTSYSGDFGADLIIEKNNRKIAIQAKNYSGNVGLEAVQQALSGKSYYKCNEAMVITNSYFTRQAIELAGTSGVDLVNRDKLKDIIDRKIIDI